VQAKTLL